MTQLGPYFRKAGDDRLLYWCEGCRTAHQVKIAGPGAWGFNGDYERPTFTPSVLVTSGHYMPGHDPSKGCYCNKPPPDGAAWGFACRRCHTFIRGGIVEFLSDCTHALAGQSRPMAPLPGDQA